MVARLVVDRFVLPHQVDDNMNLRHEGEVKCSHGLVDLIELGNTLSIAKATTDTMVHALVLSACYPCHACKYRGRSKLFIFKSLLRHTMSVRFLDPMSFLLHCSAESKLYPDRAAKASHRFTQTKQTQRISHEEQKLYHEMQYH